MAFVLLLTWEIFDFRESFYEIIGLDVEEANNLYQDLKILLNNCDDYLVGTYRYT